jgi:hypothetical protein
MEPDVIKVNVPTFIRLLELARETLKSDAQIHFIAEKATELSKKKTITMSDYADILSAIK